LEEWGPDLPAAWPLLREDWPTTPEKDDDAGESSDFSSLPKTSGDTLCCRQDLPR
jgi:hypothetical protein